MNIYADSEQCLALTALATMVLLLVGLFEWESVLSLMYIFIVSILSYITVTQVELNTVHVPLLPAEGYLRVKDARGPLSLCFFRVPGSCQTKEIVAMLDSLVFSQTLGLASLKKPEKY